MSVSTFKKPLILILATVIAAIGLVASLAWVALKPINQKNGFNRKFIATEVKRLEISKIDQNIVGISGVTNHQIYFQTTNPTKLWITNRNLKDGKYININIPYNNRILSHFITVVDSPAISVMAGNAPVVIKTNLSGNILYLKKFPTGLFTRSVVISPNSYVFRGFDTTEAGQIFIKGNPQTGEIFKKNNAISNNDETGILTDGSLNYDEKVNLITYVSFYHNQFFCLDTNLIQLYSSHTIDTVTGYIVKPEKTRNFVTNIFPTRIVNAKSRVANGKLYVISKLKADNELEKEFDNSITLDVYDISNGKYKGSFYIPFYKRERIRDFKVVGNSIIVVYKKHLAIYLLPKALNV